MRSNSDPRDSFGTSYWIRRRAVEKPVPGSENPEQDHTEGAARGEKDETEAPGLLRAEDHGVDALHQIVQRADAMMTARAAVPTSRADAHRLG